MIANRDIYGVLFFGVWDSGFHPKDMLLTIYFAFLVSLSLKYKKLTQSITIEVSNK